MPRNTVLARVAAGLGESDHCSRGIVSSHRAGSAGARMLEIRTLRVPSRRRPNARSDAKARLVLSAIRPRAALCRSLTLGRIARACPRDTPLLVPSGATARWACACGAGQKQERGEHLRARVLAARFR
jgi:hypothetical protein